MGQSDTFLRYATIYNGKGSQNKSGDNRRWKSNGWLH